MDHSVFNPEQVYLDQQFDSKEQLLSFVAQKFAAAVLPGQEEKIYQAMVQREQQSSTAVGGGIAIPHCSLAEVQDFSLLILTLRQGMDFTAFDNQHCRLFFCIIGPQSDRSSHVRLLSTLTVGLSKTDAYQQLLTCKTAQSFISLLLRLMEIPADNRGGDVVPLTAPGAQSASDYPVYKVELYCQRERVFQTLLEELSAISSSAPVVIEATNISRYLSKVPLFAAILADDKPHRFLRLIIGVVSSQDLPKLKQRVEQLLTNKKNSGLLLLCLPISSACGAIDY